MNILLVYPEMPDTFWGFKHALQFVSKKVSSPPLGLATVAAMLPKEWNKKLVDLNIHSIRKSDIEWADYVFISAMVVQRESTYKVIELSKKAGKKIVAGGPLITSETDKFDQVDYLVLNEAELTLPPFLEDLAKGTPKHIYSTTEHADITKTPIPLYELLELKYYDSLSIQFTRGCPFDCEFCSVTAMLGHKVRTKTTAQILAEMDRMYELGWRRSIFFVDDNFIGNKKILKQEILPALIEWRKGKEGCRLLTEASINLADDDELIDLMTQAGFQSVFIGIETPDDTCLTEAHKAQNNNRNLLDCVKKIQQKGLQVMGGFIVGFDNDKPSIFQQQIDFIQNSGIVTAMVGLLQAPHGTRLYQRMKDENRLVDEMSGDNADGTTNIIPKMDIFELEKGYHQILDVIYSPKYFYIRVKNFLSMYKPVEAAVRVEKVEILAFFRSIFRLGIIGKERKYYWRLFFWTLFNHPDKFPLAITMTIYGYHFRMVNQCHQLSPA